MKVNLRKKLNLIVFMFTRNGSGLICKRGWRFSRGVHYYEGPGAFSPKNIYEI
jgi:hypothetical protein